MRFGTYYFFQAPPWLSHEEVVHRELEQFEWTEDLSYDSIWLTEHLFIDYGLAVDPATLAAAAILPFHHPLRLAEQFALVDVISRGRLDMGVGRGNRPTEFRGYQVPQQESRARFEEAVDILMHAWNEERFSYDGRFFTIKDAHVIPRPVQKPHPPMYQVCVSREGIETAARRGWAMLNSVLFGTLEPLVTSCDTYVDTLRQAGRSEPAIQALLARWGVSRHIYVAPTDAQAFEEAKDSEMWYQEAFKRFVIPERIEDTHPSLQPGFRQLAETLAEVTWDKLLADRTLAFGSPDTVARHVEEMQQLGIGQLLCWMNFGGLAQDKIRRSMELFAREVIPHFRETARA